MVGCYPIFFRSFSYLSLVGYWGPVGWEYFAKKKIDLWTSKELGWGSRKLAWVLNSRSKELEGLQIWSLVSNTVVLANLVHVHPELAWDVIKRVWL